MRLGKRESRMSGQLRSPTLTQFVEAVVVPALLARLLREHDAQIEGRISGESRAMAMSDDSEDPPNDVARLTDAWNALIEASFSPDHSEAVKDTHYLRKLDAAGINIDEVADIAADGTTSLVYHPTGPLPADDRLLSMSHDAEQPSNDAARLTDAWNALIEASFSPGDPEAVKVTGAVIPADDRPEVTPTIGKNQGRFTYWLRSDVNPWADLLHGERMYDREQPSRDTHAAVSAHYRALHEAGDTAAPFDYVSVDAWAFRSPWLQQLVERWRDQGDKKKLERLMSRYSATGGKRLPVTILSEIRRDQAIYGDLLERGTAHGTRHVVLEEICKHRNVSIGTVREIREHYDALWSRVEALGLFPSPGAMLADLKTTISRIAIEADPT